MTVQPDGYPEIIKDSDGHYRKFKNDKVICALCYEGERNIKLAKYVGVFPDEELDVCDFHSEEDTIKEIYPY